MRFAHLADVHIGAWRDPAMKSLSIESLKNAVDMIIEKRLDFTIIAGDLFNTAVPAIDHLQETVILLKKLKNVGIPVYIVPGSHDYSAAGKTILDVLEEADLLQSVMKGNIVNGKLMLNFTRDPLTGVKLTGLGGRKGSLEMKEYEKLDLDSLETEPGKKIFLFHTSIEELKPDEMYSMLSVSINEFPRGFDYYAGGHVHVVDRSNFEDRENVVYPGPIFPANFHELWHLKQGGFFIYENGVLTHQAIKVRETYNIDVSAQGKTPEKVFHELESKIQGKDFKEAIILIKVYGLLKSGKASDIDFKSIFSQAYNTGAYFVMRSTTQLTSEEMAEMTVSSGSADELEDSAITQYLSVKKGMHDNSQEAARIKSLIHALSDEQKDGEKKYEYDLRIKKEAEESIDF